MSKLIMWLAINWCITVIVAVCVTAGISFFGGWWHLVSFVVVSVALLACVARIGLGLTNIQ